MKDTKNHESPVLQLALPKKIDEETLDSFFRESPSSSLKEVHLDFALTERVDRSFYQTLYRLKRELASHGIKLKSLNISKNVRIQFSENGTDSFLDLAKTSEIQVAGAYFVQSFVKSTLAVLQVHAKMDGQLQAATLKSKFKAPYCIEIAGVVSVVSDHFMGSVALIFPRATFLKICGVVYNTDLDKNDDDAETCAAELLNMIFNGAKSELNKERAYNIQNVFPTIIRAHSLKLRQHSSDATIVLPFTTSAGAFHIEIELVKKK